MHILFVTHYYEPDSGATSVLLTRLSKSLHRRGHKITVLTTMPHYPQGVISKDYRGKLFNRENRDGIEVIQAWLWATPSKSIARRLISQLSFMIMACLRGLFLERPDIVFVENQPIFTGVAGRFIADIKRVPYVLDISDLWPDHLLSIGALTQDSLIYKSARAVVDAGYRGSAHIITASPTWEDKIKTYIKRDLDKITTIIYGVDTQRFQPLSSEEIEAFQSKYGLDSQKLWVSFLGTFATQYDFHLLLDVAEHFRNREDVGFVFIGTGSERELVRERVQSGALPNLKLIDWVDHEEMPAAWNASTLTYWAMRDDDLYTGTIPAKLYESMACGVPIVAAHGGQAEHIIREADAGRVVAPADSEALIKELETMLSDVTLRAKCSQNAREYALANFDTEVIATQYETILQAQIGSG